MIPPAVCVVAVHAAGAMRFVDLLPQHAGKGSAMQHVRQRFAFDEGSTVACGDAMNDLLMLKTVR